MYCPVWRHLPGGETGGLGALATFGYLYGILRANYPETASRFIFDAAVARFLRSSPLPMAECGDATTIEGNLTVAGDRGW